jgi:predicted NBD/HSP70 family sugar kinase
MHTKLLTLSKFPKILGLESGGTKLVATVGDATGLIDASRTIPRPAHYRAADTLLRLSELGAGLIDDFLGANRIAAVGFGFGGAVDRTRNRPILSLHESGWNEIDATLFLEQRFHVPVYCENDCKVAALAEAVWGNGSKEGVSVYVTVGSGIGAGLVKDGRILKCGPVGEAEFGHLLADPEGPVCPCGNRGCLEAMCSGWGIAGRARHYAAQLLQPSPLAKSLDALDERHIAYQVFSAYPHDPLAVFCVNEFCLLMGRACAALANLLAPRAIVFGGGVMQSEWLVPRIAAVAQTHIAPYLKPLPRFALAAAGERSVSLGAILHAAQQEDMVQTRNSSSPP